MRTFFNKIFSKSYTCKCTDSCGSKLVNIAGMVKKARAGGYAVAQININNLEWIVAALEGAQECKSPIILGVSEGAAKYMCGFKNVVNMVNNVIVTKNITVPVAVHLDHGSFEGAKKALLAGFSSIMFDGSSQKFEINIEQTKELIQLAKNTNASVETEVGTIGGEEDGHAASGELANIDECISMSKLDISCLAAGIGNIHGIYPANWKGLDFDQLKKIGEATNEIPLVLHGGTGIPENQIRQAISLGVAKINVNTECQLAFAEATRKYIEAKSDLDTKNKGFDPRKLLKPGTNAIKNVTINKINMFGSGNKA